MSRSRPRRDRPSRCKPSSRVAVAFGVLALGLLSAAPAAAEEPSIDEVDYDPAVLPPPGVRSRLLWTGAALAVGWYGASLGTSFLWDEAPNASRLRLPVVGPWAALGDVGCGSSESRCSTGTVVLRTAVAVASGVGQFGGLVVLVEGAFLPSAGDAPAPQSSWLAVPTLTGDGFGLEVSGRF